MRHATGDGLQFRHVDVFATSAFSGNGLIVAFVDSLDHPAERLRRVTEEMRQFETIFVAPGPAPTTVTARIFTVEEELPFAGHPVLGAAAALHERTAPLADRMEWRFVVGNRHLPVLSERGGGYFSASMDQGSPELSAPLPSARRAEAAAALALDLADLADLPLQVVSTGLPYLVVPVAPEGLARARIVTTDFGDWLHRLGADFVYVLDPAGREGRTWDNHGRVEDVATGSAAGPAAAYLRAQGLVREEPLELRQGRFTGRPSILTVTPDAHGHLWVGGQVHPVASGVIDLLPPDDAGAGE